VRQCVPLLVNGRHGPVVDRRPRTGSSPQGPPLLLTADLSAFALFTVQGQDDFWFGNLRLGIRDFFYVL
jgi:hypothetical protein